jgi:hypothetical protein
MKENSQLSNFLEGQRTVGGVESDLPLSPPTTFPMEGKISTGPAPLSPLPLQPDLCQDRSEPNSDLRIIE